MIVSFHPCFDTDRQVVLGDRPLSAEYMEWIHGAEAIILPQGCTEELYRRCAQSGAQVFPDYEKRFQYPGKVGQSLLFEDVGCVYPETRCWTCVEEFFQAHGNVRTVPHRFPFFIKEDRTHEGEGVHLIHGKESLSLVLDELRRKERSGQKGFITQEYISTHGNVLRAVIIGSRVITYWKRASDPEMQVVSLGKGARVDHRWRPELQKRGREAAESFSRVTGINLAAIDFLLPVEGAVHEPLFLEINYYFGRRGLGGTLAFYWLVYEAIQEWLKERGVDPGRVRLV